MSNSPLLDQIKAEIIALEALSRRKGFITLRMIDEALQALPASIRKQLSLHHHKCLCDALNAALYDASEPSHHDPKSKAAGDA